jgi:NAD(P)H-hydrate epimerase
MALTRAQAHEIDRRAVEEYGMPSLLLMENAGRGVADVIDRVVIEHVGDARLTVVCCGVGNNGGDGFVIARHLDLRGHEVRVLVWGDTSKTTADAGTNLAILEKSGIVTERFEKKHDAARLASSLEGATCIVDAILGTGARGEPRPPLDAVIDQLNAVKVSRVAVDLPSGLDCDTGVAASHTIRADHTCTFVARKAGFDVAGTEAFTGIVHVLDIGAPRVLIATTK